MPSPLRSPKTLFDWLELDYYRRPRQLRRLRSLVIWLVLGMTAALLALTLWLGRQSLYQAGPLSVAHAMFDNDCARCHTEAFQPARRLLPSNAELRSVKNDSCKACHDGPIHHKQQVGDPSCSSCHQEHRGHPLLAQVANSHCTSCHANLRRKDGSQPAFQNVSSFAYDHPEFALWRDEPPKDPGRLHFNHQAHLTLQSRGVPGPDGKPMTEELACQSCHRPDAQRQYMLPVNYEQHCAQCHPLSVQLDGSWNNDSVREAAAKFRAQPAPHKAPAVVRAALRDRLTELVQRTQAILEPDSSSPASLPRLPWRQAAEQKLDEQAWVKQQLRQTERILFDGGGGCQYCHLVKDQAAPRANPSELPCYLVTNLPTRWFRHSHFSHASHQMVKCTECHAAETSRLTSDVLMPRIESCRKCHTPQVGARSDCVQCHHYHDHSRDHGPKEKLTIGDYLVKPGVK